MPRGEIIELSAGSVSAAASVKRKRKRGAALNRPCSLGASGFPLSRE
jgi:hypothetical protein